MGIQVEPEIVMQETKRSVERVRDELKRLEGVLRLEREELLVLEALHGHSSAESSSDTQQPNPIQADDENSRGFSL